MTTILNVRTPQWANTEHTLINCEIEEATYGWIPFTASPTDTESHSVQVYNDCVDGEYGQIADYVALVVTADQNKGQATALLAATDWVNQPDVYDESLTPHLLNRSEYLTYRSQLRAIAIAPTAGALDWPTQPTPQWS